MGFATNYMSFRKSCSPSSCFLTVCFKTASGAARMRAMPPAPPQAQVTSCRGTSCPAKDQSPLPTFSGDSRKARLITAWQTQKCDRTKTSVQILVVPFSKINTQIPSKTWFLNINQKPGLFTGFEN